VIANEHEIGQLGYASPGELLTAGAGSVVVTHGAEGAELHLPRTDPSRHLAPQVRVVDTTGAGDAFAGAFAWAMSRGRDLSDATEAGIAAGAIATLKAGARASLASPVELETLLRGSPR
jgi:ribokinase